MISLTNAKYFYIKQIEYDMLPFAQYKIFIIATSAGFIAT